MNEPLDYPISPKNHPVREVEYVNFDNVLCIVFDADVFTLNMTTFGQFKSDENGKNFRLIMQLFAAISSDTSLGYEYEEMSESEKKKVLELKRRPCIIHKESGEVLPRIRRFLERIVDKDNSDITLGWRLFLIPYDPTFSFGLAIQNLISRNCIERTKYLESNPRFRNSNNFNIIRDRYKILTSSDIYINNVVSTYLKKSTNEYDIKRASDYLLADGSFESSNYLGTPTKLFSMDNAFSLYKFESSMAGQNQMENYYHDSDVLAFPIPENVWEVSHMAFTPLNMDRLRVFHITMRNNPDINDEKYRDMTSRLLMSRTDHIMDDPGCVVDNDIKAVSLRNIRELERIKRMDESTKEKAEEKQKEYKLFQRFARSDFASLWSDDANLSPSINAMLDWYNTKIRDGEREGIPFSPFYGSKPLDRSLSPFANMIIGILTQLEVVSKVSVAHWHFMLCWIASLDAYRHAYDMKLNVILAGPGASSKSFIIRLLSTLSMKGSIQPVTHQTRRALNVDEPIVNVVNTYDEFPVLLTGHDKDAGESGDSTIKSSITEGKIVNNVFHRNEITGKRTARTTEIDCQRSIIGATNEHVANIPEALASRYHVTLLSGADHPDRSLLDVINVIESDRSDAFQRRFKQEMEFYRYLTALTFKMIQCKVLPEVNVNIASTVFNKLLSNLKKQGYKVGNPRLVKRMTIMARILTILNAIHITFFSEKAIRPPGSKFDLSMMYTMTPLLVCSEEVAIFAFSFFSDSIINNMEREVVLALLSLVNRQVDSEEGDDARFLSVPLPDGSMKVDYDYYFFKYKENRAISFKPAAHAIKSVIIDKRVSPENLDAIMKKMRDRPISCKSYSGTDALSTELGNEDNSRQTLNTRKRNVGETSELSIKELARILSENPSHQSGRVQQKPIIQVDTANGGIKILRHFVEVCAKQMHMENDERYKPPVIEAIDSLSHKYTRGRRILTSLPCPGFRDSAPHVFRVVELKPVDKVMQTPNSNVLTETERIAMGVSSVASDVTAPILVVDNDMEDLEVYRHITRDDILIDVDDYKKYSPMEYEKFEDGPSVTYPTTYLEEIKEKQSITRKIRMGGSESSHVVGLSDLIKKKRRIV